MAAVVMDQAATAVNLEVAGTADWALPFHVPILLKDVDGQRGIVKHYSYYMYTQTITM